MEIHWTAFLKKCGITQEDFSEDIAHSSVLEMKKNGMDSEANGMTKHLQKVVIPYSEVEVRSTEES